MKLKFSEQSQIQASSWMYGGSFPIQKFKPFLTVGSFASCQNASPAAWSVVIPTCGYWNPACWTKERKSARQMWNPKEDFHPLLSTALPPHAPMDFLGSIFVVYQSLTRQGHCPGLTLSAGGKYSWDIWNGYSLTLILGSSLSLWSFLVRPWTKFCCWGLQVAS